MERAAVRGGGLAAVIAPIPAAAGIAIAGKRKKRKGTNEQEQLK